MTTVHPTGALAHELLRSPAAARVGDMAVESGLLFAHFERRLELPLPEGMDVVGRPDLGLHPTDPDAPGWVRGTLPETKFRTFRLDRRVSSLHPGHGPKWTAHELCHGLVGFGWAPGMSRLWHAQAARLAEVLPVALWYFHDEAGLRRCDRHAGGGPLFGQRCADCDAAAALGPVEAPAAEVEAWHAGGRAYVEREIDAAWRSLREGRSVPNRHGPLELGSDGLAYATAHGPVLQSQLFHRYLDLFFDEGEGWLPTLDALIARVRAVQDALCGGAPARPWVGGRWAWIAQDIGWRLLSVLAETEGDCAEELDQLTEALADDQSEDGVLRCVEAYTALHEDWVVPPPEDVFAVGYPIGVGLGVALGQLEAGVQSALPGASRLLGGALPQLVRRFAAVDGPARAPLGDRFAAFLSAEHPGAAADQARLDAAFAHLPPPDLDSASLPVDEAADDRLRLPRHVRVLSVNHAVSADPDLIDPALGLEPVQPTLHLAAIRRPDGEVELMEVEDLVLEALARAAREAALPEALGLSPEAALSLLEAGVLCPVSWR
jgi:hypothetical protein